MSAYGRALARLLPASLAVLMTASCRLATNVWDPESPFAGGAQITLSAVGSVLAPGGTFDFGVVAVGSSETVTFTIQNTGPGVLEFTGDPPVFLAGSGAGSFEVVLPTVTSLAAFETARFRVTYAPASGSASSAEMTVTSSDPLNGSLAVSLTGSTGSGVSDLTPGSHGTRGPR